MKPRASGDDTPCHLPRLHRTSVCVLNEYYYYYYYYCYYSDYSYYYYYYNYYYYY